MGNFFTGIVTMLLFIVGGNIGQIILYILFTPSFAVVFYMTGSNCSRYFQASLSNLKDHKDVSYTRSCMS